MKKYVLTFITFFMLGTPLATNATSVRPASITDLTHLSQYIFKGKILTKEIVYDKKESGRVLAVYTALIEDCIKCPDFDLDVTSWKQVANGRFEFEGLTLNQNFKLPEYQEGETSVFFLSPPHENGITAPVGLYQGVFKIIKVNGQETIPQLKYQKHLLQPKESKIKAAKNSKNKFLKLQLKTLEDDQSYDNFRSLIEAAGD